MIVKITCKSVDIMCGVSKDHDKYVVVENGHMGLYLNLNKALYGHR